MAIRAGLVAAVLLVATSARAQSLADAARLAEEQTKAQSRPSQVFKDSPDFYFSEMPLKSMFSAYAGARGALSRLFARDRTVYQAVRDGGSNVTRFRDFATVLESEPRVVDTLKAFGLSPRTFVKTEVTVRHTILRRQGGTENRPATGVEAENDLFLQQHSTLDWTYRSWELQDGGLWFWPDASYW